MGNLLSMALVSTRAEIDKPTVRAGPGSELGWFGRMAEGVLGNLIAVPVGGLLTAIAALKSPGPKVLIIGAGSVCLLEAYLIWRLRGRLRVGARIRGPLREQLLALQEEIAPDKSNFLSAAQRKLIAGLVLDVQVAYGERDALKNLVVATRPDGERAVKQLLAVVGAADAEGMHVPVTR